MINYSRQDTVCGKHLLGGVRSPENLHNKDIIFYPEQDIPAAESELTPTMSSVMKIVRNFKNNHLQAGRNDGKSRSQGRTKSTSATAPPSEKTNSSIKYPVAGGGGGGQATGPGGGAPLDDLHRRRMSVSKSGRYRDNNKKRTALQEADEAFHSNGLTSLSSTSPTFCSSSKPKEMLDKNFAVLRQKVAKPFLFF